METLIILYQRGTCQMIYNNVGDEFGIDDTDIIFSDGVERIVIFTLNNGDKHAIHTGDGYVKDVTLSQAKKLAKQKQRFINVE